jgi:hypothetical protein
MNHSPGICIEYFYYCERLLRPNQSPIDGKRAYSRADVPAVGGIVYPVVA